MPKLKLKNAVFSKQEDLIDYVIEQGGASYVARDLISLHRLFIDDALRKKSVTKETYDEVISDKIKMAFVEKHEPLITPLRALIDALAFYSLEDYHPDKLVH